MKKPEFTVNFPARTVKHNPTGLILHFRENTDGTWDGTPLNESVVPDAWWEQMPAVCRRMGDKFLEALREKA